MRRRRDHVDACVRRQVGVLRAGRIHVHERTGAVEVLRIRQEVKNLRRGAGLFGAPEQAIDRAALGVGLRAVGERKDIDRE